MLGEQSTKSQILEATIALLKSGGESAVKVGLIAEELGIAAPSLYHHFANRAELIRAAYVEWYWQCLRIVVQLPSWLQLQKPKSNMRQRCAPQ